MACLPGYGGLAQLGERGVRNAEVEGSNPLPSTIKYLQIPWWPDDPRVGSSVIRMITITALFHPARHGTRRPVALHSRWFGRWPRRHGRRLGSAALGRSRRRNRGRERKARQIFENAIEIADLHRLLLHHGRHGSGELID